MNRALADETLRSKLGECRVPTEFYDKDGRVLGVFTPEDVRERRRYERAKSQISQEELAELERRSQDKGGFTSAQVMQRLRA
jgi:hypothetical protein